MNIINRMQATTELGSNHALVSEALRIAHVGFFEFIVADGSTIWSEEQYRIYGYDPAGPSPTIHEIAARSILPEDKDWLLKKFIAALENLQDYDQEHRLIWPDGSVHWVHTRAHPYFDEKGRLQRYVGTSQDITERKRAEQHARELTADLKATLDAIPDLLFELDQDGRYLKIWAHSPDLLAAQESALLGKTVSEMLPLDAAACVMEVIRDAIEKGYSSGRVIQLDLHQGVKWFELTASLKSVTESSRSTVVMLSRDISERMQALELLSESENRYRRLVENSPDVVYVFSSKRGGVYYSPRAEVLLGYPIEHLYENSFLWNESIHPEDQLAIAEISQARDSENPFSLEYRIRDAVGNWKWVHDRSMRKTVQGDELLIEGLVTDITPFKYHQQQLERAAHYDALTGIPNRVLVADRMKQALAHARRNNVLLAVCYLDLDGFKSINDNYGHNVGDRILVEVARRIDSEIRGDDTVARLGGDEFVILLVGMVRPDECACSLDRLLQAIAQPINVDGRVFTISASIGVTLFPDGGCPEFCVNGIPLLLGHPVLELDGKPV